jgi:signal transduction histidine kinase/CheY-like chemotaxis protein
MILAVAHQLSTLLLCALMTLILSFGPLSRLSNLWRNLLIGLTFGAVIFLGQTNAYVLPGTDAPLDSRAGPMLLAGVIGGWPGALVTFAVAALARLGLGGPNVLTGIAFLAGFAVVGLIANAADLRRPLSEHHWGHVSRRALVICLAGYLVVQFLPPILYPSVIVQGTADYRGPAFALAFLLTGVTSILATAGVINLLHSLSRAPVELERLARRTERAHVAARIGTFDAAPGTGLAHFDLGMKQLYGMDSDPGPVSLTAWAEGIHPEDRASFAQSLDQARAGGERGQVEFRYRQAGGAESRILSHWFSEREPNGAVARIMGVHVDLTAIRASEAELITQTAIANTAQKDAAIGKLSGGIAHDFNNILAVILGNLEMLAERETEAEAQGMITAGITAVQRGAGLTRSLLAFARQSRLDPVLVNLNDLVRETRNWAGRAMPANVVIDTALLAGLWPVRVDPDATVSALLNLLVNARDAMPQGGRLTLETSNLRIDEAYLLSRHEDVPPGRYVMLAVSDTGKGMDAETLARIFEPFFSTKPASSNSGLGLSMVLGFLKQSGGTVRVYSELGVGTTFKLYFPADTSTIPHLREAQALPSERFAAPGPWVLLAEDEPDLLKLLTATLEAAGCQVTACRSGDAAAAVFAADPKFDLLVTDIVMPGLLQGTDLARHLRKSAPDLPVIFMSGYASEASVHGNGLRPEDIRLMKPVPRSDLLRSVQTALRKK